MVRGIYGKLTLTSVATIAAFMVVIGTVYAQPVAALFGPNSVIYDVTYQWSCDITYNAWGWNPAYYQISYHFTFEEPYFSRPVKTGGAGPIWTSAFYSSQDPNFGHIAWISGGSTTVYMWPWQSVVQRQDSTSDGSPPSSIAKVNCTTGTGHQIDQHDDKDVYIHN